MSDIVSIANHCKNALPEVFYKELRIKEAFNSFDFEQRKIIQTVLSEKKLYDSKIDGKFGKATIASVERYLGKNMYSENIYPRLRKLVKDYKVNQTQSNR